MEHLQEIRMLRQRLEESIKTNEKLREQLERQIANAGLDQDKQNENEKLREALSQKTFLVEHIHSDYESIKKENEKLQQQLCARDEEISCLTQDIYKSHNELKRLQSEINLQKHHFYEEKQVQQLLQIEQNLYKKMNEAIRNTDTDAEDMNICKLQYHVFQTHKTCDTCPEDKNIQISSLSNVAALKDNGDSSSECSSSSAASSYAPSRLVPGCHLWADKNGSHILGLIEDYNALRKQITEGRKLVCGMQAYLEDIQSIKPQASRIEIGDQGSSTNFSANVARVQQTLEEAKRLLKLFWRVSLPINTVHSATHFGQDEEIKSETARLRRKLSEYETKLHSTMKRLYCTNQLKEDMEKVIINQLALTHNVLKKARGNLEIQPVEVQH
ncbi:CDK5 regulatory subunit-associated protein 2-like [Rhinatrema bivittatum]|uniref:CDK5 regulatory subunit-associated protein 2-like n=1 Tax=Rhinatrema bivittatum TaxID=194408 RepID=UPI0011276FC3|nr:CDK5 regulatory subunit-associated protein 2-like [Rhinatrema bivittatum]